MTVTTVADEESQEPQELGRVGGWIASFDKLLEDPLGVTCLQVGPIAERGGERGERRRRRERREEEREERVGEGERKKGRERTKYTGCVQGGETPV